MLENSKKEKCLCLMTSFESIYQFLNQKKYLIEALSKAFEKFYLINSENLEFFLKKNDISLEEIKKQIPNNCIVFDPKTSNEFISFCNNKELIIISNIGRLWTYFRIHYLIKKTNSKLIYIQNIGNFQTTAYPKLRSVLTQVFLKHLPHKVVIFLSILKIFPIVELRFLSNKFNYNKATNNFFYKLSQKNKFLNLFYTKEFVPINSLAFDVNSSNQLIISEEKIVMVDTNINHKDNLVYWGRISDEKVKKIYITLEFFLKKISNIFNKPVVICVHPSQNIELIKNYLKDFEIVKYKTKENIYKSFITFFYDSSSIVDAFLLKKKIIVLENEMMGKSITTLCNQYPLKTGIMKVNLNQDFYIKDKALFLKKIEETAKSKKYNDFINNNLQSDGNYNGTQKIIKIIKSKFFN